MGTFGVDGLVSGLDTTSLINQLMQLEAQPQTRLKATVAQTQSALSAYQSINSKLSALATAAANLRKDATWKAVTATSSDPAVVATSNGTGSAGSITFSVDQLASAQTVVSSTVFTSTSDTTSLSGFPIQILDSQGNVRASITPTDGSLGTVVAAINSAANTGVQAAAIQVAPGQYRLQITSTTTGAASAFSVTGLGGAGTLDTVTAAADARLHVGPVGGGYDVVSPTNTVEGLLPGVTVRLTKTSPAVTVDVTANPDTTADAVKSLVDAANSVLSEIARQTATGTTAADGTRSGQGALAGNALMRDLTDQVIRSVSGVVGSTPVATTGVSITRDGTVTFDRDAFLAQLASAPDSVRSVLAPTDPTQTGVAGALATVADNATHTGTGSVVLAIAGENSMIKDLTDRIADWDVRLAQKQQNLQRTYSALEVALSGLKNQSTWLSGQLAGLPSGG